MEFSTRLSRHQRYFSDMILHWINKWGRKTGLYNGINIKYLLGSDFSLIRQQIEASDLDIKARKIEIKKAKKHVKERVKICIEIPGVIENLFIMNDYEDHIGKDSFLKLSEIRSTYWTGVIPFQIPMPFIFGRVNKKVSHGGGIYCFSELDPNILQNYGLPDFTLSLKELTSFIEDENNVRLLRALRNHDDIKNLFRPHFERVRKKSPTGSPYIDALNANSILVRYLQKVPHLGEAEVYWDVVIESGSYKFKSDVDISTLLIPYKGATLFQMGYYMEYHERTIRALLELIVALKR